MLLFDESCVRKLYFGLCATQVQYKVGKYTVIGGTCAELGLRIMVFVVSGRARMNQDLTRP